MINLSQETEALALRIAQVKRVAVDEAIRGALENEALAQGITLEVRRPRDPSSETRAARIARFEEIAQAAAALPVLDPRPTQEIIDDLNTL